MTVKLWTKVAKDLPLGGATIKTKRILAYKSHTAHHTFIKLISTCSLIGAECPQIGHTNIYIWLFPHKIAIYVRHICVANVKKKFMGHNRICCTCFIRCWISSPSFIAIIYNIQHVIIIYRFFSGVWKQLMTLWCSCLVCRLTRNVKSLFDWILGRWCEKSLLGVSLPRCFQTNSASAVKSSLRRRELGRDRVSECVHRFCNAAPLVPGWLIERRDAPVCDWRFLLGRGGFSQMSLKAVGGAEWPVSHITTSI